MPEEQTFERIERAYEMPEYMQAAEAMDLRGPRGEIGDPGIETAELHVDGNTIGHFTVNAGDIWGQCGARQWRLLVVLRFIFANAAPNVQFICRPTASTT